MPQVTARSRIARSRFAAVLLAAGLFGCTEPNSLEGSLAESVDLRFDAVEATLGKDVLSLSYTRARGEGRDVVFKLTVELDDPAAARADLTPRPDGTPRASATRAVAEDPIHTFAAVRRGSLELAAPPKGNDALSGSFRVLFGEGGEAGEGRTVYGHFEIDAVGVAE